MSKDIVIGLQISIDSSYYNKTKEPLPWLDIPSLSLGGLTTALLTKYGDMAEILIADDYLDVAAIDTASKNMLGEVVIAGLGHTLLENLNRATKDNVIPVADVWPLHIKLNPRHRAPPPGVMLFAICANTRRDLKILASKLQKDFKSPSDIFAKEVGLCDSILPNDIHLEVERTLGIHIIKECRIFMVIDPHEVFGRIL